MKMRLADLGFGSWLKIFAFGSIAFWTLGGVMFGIIAFFGGDTVAWNGAYVHGVPGLIGGVIMGPLFGAIFGLLWGALTAIIMKALSVFLPLGVVEFNVDPAPTADR